MTDDGILEIADHDLDHLMPMHVVISHSGHIVRVGPTLAKFRPEIPFVGARFLEVFRVRRPSLPAGQMADLAALSGRRLQLEIRDSHRTGLRGMLVPLKGQQAFIVNLSFGIATLARLDRFNLSSSDFAPTDHTIEILYLQEAKSIVEAEYRRLTSILKLSKSEAERRALTDPLTGLGNRAAMEADLSRLIVQRRDFSLIHLDLDLFKAVNDTLGHAAGDAVLVETARRLRQTLRDADFVNRVGGDEFVILAEGLKDRARLDDLCHTIIRNLERPIPFKGELCRISGSIGYAVSYDYPDPEMKTMMAHADTALYAAKRAGRGRAVGYSGDLPPLSDQAAE